MTTKKKMLTEKHNDEKLVVALLIVGSGLIAYLFWYFIIYNRWCPGECISLQRLKDLLNFVFARLTDHGEEERERRDLALQKMQRARDAWNRDGMKQLDVINKRLPEKNEARACINNVDEAMPEYYQVFAKQIKP